MLESAYGFATYVLHPEECYIEDVYVIPERRRSGVGAKLVDKISEVAKAHGCKRLVTTVNIKTTGRENSLIACFNCGFKIITASNDIIYLGMELRNG
jgi:GNAT superfamily N-acetyltransferase